MEQCVAHLVEGAGGIVEMLHLGGDGTHLVEVALGGLGELGHAGELVGGGAHLCDTVGERAGVFLAQVDAGGETHGIARLAGSDRAGRCCARAGDYHAAVAAREVGAVFRILAVEHGEYLFPLVLLGRAVKGSEDKHQHLSAHAYRQQGVAARQMEDFEESAPDDYGGADGVCEVEETLAFLAGDESSYAALVLLYFSHCDGKCVVVGGGG